MDYWKYMAECSSLLQMKEGTGLAEIEKWMWIFETGFDPRRQYQHIYSHSK